MTRGLTGNDIEIAKESHTVKLDWLVRERKRRRKDDEDLKTSINAIRERIDWIESSELETSKTSRKLLLEMYSILLAVFWAEKNSLEKLIKLTATTHKELQYPEDTSVLTMAGLLATCVKDLDGLARFHNLKIGSEFGDVSYSQRKAELMQNFISNQQKKREER